MKWVVRLGTGAAIFILVGLPVYMLSVPRLTQYLNAHEARERIQAPPSAIAGAPRPPGSREFLLGLVRSSLSTSETVLAVIWTGSLIVFMLRLRVFLAEQRRRAQAAAKEQGRRRYRVLAMSENAWRKTILISGALFIGAGLVVGEVGYEFFNEYIEYYRCNLARNRIAAAMEKYDKYCPEVDLQSFLMRFDDARKEYLKKCDAANAARCGRYGPLKQSCLHWSCSFPASVDDFGKPAGCWYYGNFQCVTHYEERR
jgi:hypothetical protein